MAIRGLTELLRKVREDGKYTDSEFEKELNKALAEDWMPKDVYNELNEKYKTANAQNDSNAKLMRELQEKANLSDDYRNKIDEMSKSHKSEIEAMTKNLARQKKDSAIERFLDREGSLNNKATRALLNDDAISINDAGELIGIEEQIKTLRKDNGFLFKAKEKSEDEDEGKKGPQFRFGGTNGSQGSGAGGNDDQSRLEKLFGL